MPVKDTARETAITAMRGSRDDMKRACTEQPLAVVSRETLARHGLTVIDGVAGLPEAFRADMRHFDDAAMRNGLRHAHLALLVCVGADEESRQVTGDNLGVAAIISVAVGIANALESEFGALTVIGYQRDADLVGMARAGVFDEFDAVLGARPAPPGEGYCYTIGGTGDTVATRTVSVAFTGDADRAPRFREMALDASSDPAEVAVVAVDGGRVELRLTANSSRLLRELSGRIHVLAEQQGEAGVEITWGEATDDMIVNRILARRTKTYA
ncbi:MAG: hypothetical protein ACRD1H_21005, partial [Vicinamibacterales bacterium]